MNDKGVCRTVPATPGLLKTVKNLNNQERKKEERKMKKNLYLKSRKKSIMSIKYRIGQGGWGWASANKR